ncbi:apolipoprotein N-acyltransferase [Parvularcula marina]|uniref:apolipoprotein N-acyltransferase n=1 Tax=Parvularcula marina TaxID=2292771 RepID=UPI00351879C5
MTPKVTTEQTTDRWGAISTLINREAKRLAETRGWSRYGIAFGFGALTATALAPYYILPALAVGLCGLVILLDGAMASQTPKRMAFLTGWAFGFGYFLFGMYWLGFAFLVQADQFGWMIPIAIPAFTGFLGLFSALPAWLAAFAWRPGIARIAALAGFWAIFEFLRGNILTGFPWNLISQSFAGTALLAQPVAWVGPYGYSLILVFLAMLPAAALTGAERLSLRPLFGFAAGIAGILLFGIIRLAGEPVFREDAPKLVIVQPNVAQRDKFDSAKQAENFRRMIELTRQEAGEAEPALAVWPENAHPYLANTQDAPGFFGSTLPQGTTLIAGTVRSWEDESHTRYGNSVAIFGTTMDGEKPLDAVYDKHHLVPFGEYLPLKGLLTSLGLSQLAPFAEGFTAGPGPRTFDAAGIKIAPLICYEDVFPRQLYPKNERPELLVVVTNDAWFGDNAGPRQHLDISRLRSIESGLPMARAANTGISGVFDARGRLLQEIPLYQQDVISIPVPSAGARTLYGSFGELMFVFLLFAAAFINFYVKLDATVEHA